MSQTQTGGARSQPYLFQARPEGCSPHGVIWGPLVFGRDYARRTLRVQPKSVEGEVNLGLVTGQGTVFEV